jgi:glutamate-1-semialdehyde aminotransferase
MVFTLPQRHTKVVFVSAAHSDEIVQQTIEIADKVLANVAARCS